MKCAIHQPNFFPWLGYFDKICKSDIFVFLDNVEYSKSSKTMSTWGNRVAVEVQSKKHWISCPVKREKGIQIISDVVINNNDNIWRKKLIKTIEYNYSKADYFNDVMPFVYRLLMTEEDYLADYNVYVIREISNRLGINRNFIRHKELYTQKHSTELLIEITKMVGCDTYICGGGASGYQDDSLFEIEGLELEYQNFTHPVYAQLGESFLPGLSIVDVLFNIGFDGTMDLINR